MIYKPRTLGWDSFQDAKENAVASTSSLGVASGSACISVEGAGAFCFGVDEVLLHPVRPSMRDADKRMVLYSCFIEMSSFAWNRNCLIQKQKYYSSFL